MTIKPVLDWSTAHRFGGQWIGPEDLATCEPGITAYLGNQDELNIFVVHASWKKFARIHNEFVLSDDFYPWCAENGYAVPMWIRWMLRGRKDGN